MPIVVRDIFRVKFGHAADVKALMKEGVAISTKAGFARDGIRLLTDVAGEPYYTFILETTHASISVWEQTSQAVRSNAEWKAWYQKFIPLIDSGERKIYAVIE